MTTITDSNLTTLVNNYIKNKSKLPIDLRDKLIGDWDVSRVTNMNSLFKKKETFNEPLNNWNVSNVTDMSQMFQFAAAFNQPLNNWNVSKVTDMSKMFQLAKSFNQPLDNWNVSNVTDMSALFYGATQFNQPLNNWNVSNVIYMNALFREATLFNQPLNNWNVSNVTDLSFMFSGASAFNQPLNEWSTRILNVTAIFGMFKNAISFNQPLNNWVLNSNINIDRSTIKEMFEGLQYPNEYLPVIQKQVRQIMPIIEQTPPPLLNVNINELCFDIINYEEVPIKTYLQDNNRVVFIFFDKNITSSIKVGIENNRLNIAINNLNDYITYECKTSNTMSPDNIITNIPYINLKNLCGYENLINLSTFKEIVSTVNNNANEKIFIFKKKDKKIYSTFRHCREGEFSYIYELYTNIQIIDEPIIKGGKLKYYKKTKQHNKRRKNRTKKINRKTRK